MVFVSKYLIDDASLFIKLRLHSFFIINFHQVIRQASSYPAYRKSVETRKQNGSGDKYPANIYLFKLTEETLEQGVEYV